VKSGGPEEREEKKSRNMLGDDGMIASYKSPLFMANLTAFKRDQAFKNDRSNNGSS